MRADGLALALIVGEPIKAQDLQQKVAAVKQAAAEPAGPQVVLVARETD